FLKDDLQPAADELSFPESAAGYALFRQRLQALVQRYKAVDFAVRLDVAGPYADNLLHFLPGWPCPPWTVRKRSHRWLSRSPVAIRNATRTIARRSLAVRSPIPSRPVLPHASRSPNDLVVTSSYHSNYAFSARSPDDSRPSSANAPG